MHIHSKLKCGVCINVKVIFAAVVVVLVVVVAVVAVGVVAVV